MKLTFNNILVLLLLLGMSGLLSGCDDSKLLCVKSAMDSSDYSGKPRAALTYDQAKEVCGVGK